MASWGSLKNYQQIPIPIPNSKAFHVHDVHQNDLVTMGFILSPKKHHDHHLIQNCDLPPPMKLFSSIQSKKKKKTETNEEDDGNLGVLKALRLSQTRAREAEAKCAAISKERDLLAFAFMEDSRQVFAYRNLVRLLEVQVSKSKQMRCDCDGKREKVDEPEGENGGFTWIMAVALCFGVAGFGFALGCKYNYF